MATGSCGNQRLPKRLLQLAKIQSYRYKRIKNNQSDECSTINRNENKYMNKITKRKALLLLLCCSPGTQILGAENSPPLLEVSSRYRLVFNLDMCDGLEIQHKGKIIKMSAAELANAISL